MVASASFSEFLREQFATLGPLTFRRMFGKTGVFCDGVMLAMVTEDALYFRVDESNKPIFEEAAAFPPLNYSKGGRSIDLAFWRAPERLFDEPDEFVVWARAPLAARTVSRREPDATAKDVRQGRRRKSDKRQRIKPRRVNTRGS